MSGLLPLKHSDDEQPLVQDDMEDPSSMSQDKDHARLYKASGSRGSAFDSPDHIPATRGEGPTTSSSFSSSSTPSSPSSTERLQQPPPPPSTSDPSQSHQTSGAGNGQVSPQLGTSQPSQNPYPQPGDRPPSQPGSPSASSLSPLTPGHPVPPGRSSSLSQQQNPGLSQTERESPLVTAEATPGDTGLSGPASRSHSSSSSSFPSPSSDQRLLGEEQQSQDNVSEHPPNSPDPPSRAGVSLLGDRVASPPSVSPASSDDTLSESSTNDTTQLIPSSSTVEEKPFKPPGGSSSSNKNSHNYKTFPAPNQIGTMADAKGGKSADGYSPYTSKTDMVPNGTTPKPAGDRTFVYILACFATIGGLLFGYDTGIVSGAMLLIKDVFHLSSFWQEAIVSGTIGAAAVFALLAGVVCDWFGRKKVIMAASFIFAIGAAVMAAANSKEVLLGGRIIVGAGIGFASMTVPVYVAESAPPDIRGRLVTLNQLFITIGILLSSIIAGAFSKTEDGWRYMLGIAGVPGVIQFIGFFFLPESPRWLIAKGRVDEARIVLKRIRGLDDVEEELQEVLEAETNKQEGFVLGDMLKTPHVRKALFIGCGLQLFQQLCGINTVIYYSATILKMAGFPPSQAIWLVCVPFAVNFLATFIGVWAVERLGRKLLLCVSFVGVTIALIVLAVGFLLSAKNSPPVNGTLSVTWVNGTLVTDKCQTYSICEDCILNDDCGYCFDDNHDGAATCLAHADKDPDLYSDYGRCRKNYTAVEGVSMKWGHGYCPTDYTWMAVLGLALFVFSFAPGLGPMPWTINSEIYPMWARGTGNAIATMINWTFNLAVSFSFLTLLETITKYGTFFLFTGVCVTGLVFTLVFVPETRNKSLEEVEELFMTPELAQKHKRERLAAKEIVVDPSAIDTKF